MLDCLAAGMANKQVARALGISVRTVTVHVSNLLRKTRLGVPDRGGALGRPAPAVGPRPTGRVGQRRRPRLIRTAAVRRARPGWPPPVGGGR